jgi:hypothetical protein
MPRRHTSGRFSVEVAGCAYGDGGAVRVFIAGLDERLRALRAETGQAIPFWRG